MAKIVANKSTFEHKAENIAFKMTGWIGSVWSLLAHTFLFLTSFSLVLFGVPFERILLVLTTLLSLEAIYLAIFIQMTVNQNTMSIKAVEEDIEEIQEDVHEIQEDVEDIQVDVEEMAEDVEEMQEDVEELVEDIEEIQEDIEEIQEDVEDIEEEMKQVDTENESDGSSKEPGGAKG